MAQVRSRHLLLSPKRYRTPAGEPIRLGYSARTGTMFRVAPDVADGLETDNLAAIPAETLDYLAGIEALVPAGEDEVSVVVERLRDRAPAGQQVRRFSIMPTAYCNMACSYCGQEHTKNPLKEQRMRKMIERVKAGLAEPDIGTVSIMWFGGEPLLGFRLIREMSAEFVAEARRQGKEYLADVTTNGSLLTERNMRILYEECKVSWLEITLDGPAEIHDRRRLRRNGANSFDHIVDLVSTVVRTKRHRGLGFGIRVNVDVQNAESVADLLADLACRGFGGDPRVKVSIHPVHAWGNDVSDREMEIKQYAQREAGWLHLAHSLGLYATFMPPRARTTTCIATTRRAELIDPNGKIYSCSEHPLVPVDRDRGMVATLDTLAPAQRRPDGMFDAWPDEVQEKKWPCARCTFLPVCGGGCPKLWHEGAIPCPSYKFNWPDRLDVLARQEGLLADEPADD